MSPILTTMHHHSLRSRPRHSDPRSDETSALRLARLAANLGNGIIQQTPESSYSGSSWSGRSTSRATSSKLTVLIEAGPVSRRNTSKKPTRY